MKIEKLELQAFGPFKGYEAIDFTFFSENRIFLIGGKTGSGKTTIFDAISYALFGKMTGEYRDDSTARSQYTTNKEIETYVKLTFSKDNRSYEIYRKPSYMVEGRKTATLAKICFKEITNGMDKVLSIKASEANPMIVKLIGFKYEQFKQIVVLPQGEFIKILNAKSSEREELLSAILDTSLYSVITDKLRDRSKELEGKIDKAKGIADEILLSYKANNLEELNSLHLNAINNFNDSSKKYKSIQRECEGLKKEIDGIEANNRNLLSLNSLKMKLQGLIDGNKDIEVERAYLLKLQAIKSLKALYDGINSKSNDFSKSQSILNEAKVELSNLMPEYNQRDSYSMKLNEATNELSKKEERYNELSSIKAKEEKISKLAIELKRLNKEKEEQESFKKLHKDRIDELNQNEVSFRHDYQENKRIIESFDIDENVRITDLYNRYLTRLDLEKRLKQYQNDINEYNNMLNLAKETLSNLENSKERIEAIIKHNELLKYKDLIKPNEPCPLCGSIHHPNPVIAPMELDYSIDSLNNEINKANNQINKLEAQIESNTKLIEDTSRDKVFELDLSKFDEVNDAYNALEEKKIKHFNKVNDNKKIENRLEEIKGAIIRSTNLYNEAVSRLEGIKLDIQKSTLEYDKLKEEVGSFLNGANLSTLRGELQKEIEDLKGIKLALDTKIRTIDSSYTRLNTTINSAKSRLDELLLEIDKLKNDLASELRKNNISYEDFKLELNSLNKIPGLSEKINSFDIMRNDYNSRINVLEGLITKNEIVDTEAIKKKLNTLLEEENTLEKAYLAANSLKNELSSALNRYNTTIGAIKDDLDSYETLEYLYELCSGKLSGMKKISIQKFVLMKLLDKILVYANHYLNLFSSNRYTLYREVGEGSSDKGLDLCVNDEHTGYMRAVSSLSGGESFMTALALALGTSECIMSINGGIKMENIFIDEGFGSLDEEALNNAIEALITLAQNGRLIGIISHVDSIKALIPEGIEVIKNKNGSKIELNN